MTTYAYDEMSWFDDHARQAQEEAEAELMQGEPPAEHPSLEPVARRAFQLSQAIERPDSLDTERGLWAIHEAHEALKDALRQAGFYGQQYVR